MLREAWRLQREQFWDPQMSGVDWNAVLARYEALLPRVRTRDELSDLIWEMQGELGTSHAYEMGGDRRVPPQYRRGFLGADLAWDDARNGYRIETILRGDSWNRDDDSPLAEPGLDVRAGDAIVAIGGMRVSRTRTPDELLVNLADRDVALDIERAGATRRVVVRALTRRAHAALSRVGDGESPARARPHRTAASATCTSPTWARGDSPSSIAATSPSSSATA